MRQNEHSHANIWIVLILILSAFAALDVGVLAWSASAISGLQLAAELLTFFTIMAGAIATVWWMRTRRL